MPEHPAVRLHQMVADRHAVLGRVVAAARDAGVGSLMLIGSLGRGAGDAWSDLDLIAVPGPDYTHLNIASLFNNRVLATVNAPRNAPIGGSYQGVCLDAAGVVLWLDVYTWPAITATIPADATALFDELHLPTSDLDFIPLITAHADPTAPAQPDSGATTLLRVAVAAKYLARGDANRLIRTLPATTGIDGVPEALHRLLTTVTEPDLSPATQATSRLIDLAAEAAATAPHPR